MKYQRELTAAVLIPAVLAILVAAPLWAWALLAALAGGLALLEFFSMMKTAGWCVSRLAGLLVFLGIVASAYFKNLTIGVVSAAVAVLLMPTIVLFSSPPEAVMLPSAAGASFASLYVGLGAASILALRYESWKPVVLLLVVVWAGDSAAYYTGKKWGKRKLAPVVSPKKSWEGFWGQLAGGTFGAALVALALSRPVDALWALPVGLVLSVVAVVGDLVESTFKRSIGIKDSGGLLPGHGGMLDRLDSLLYSAPFTFAMFLVLPSEFLR
ncbi:MAG: phosphatidate cytidylyltransferase [Thermoanaerobaculia bacterium]|nr:phosphatidate cytidylyltransferase [Thermoanaerobaculia bacterium]